MYKGTFNICAYDKMFSSRTKMLVFDMAGTTVNENGIVYQTLYETMKKYGLDVSKKDIEYWHGANKYHALEHFLSQYIGKSTSYSQNNLNMFETEKKKLNQMFDENLKERYFDKSSISLIDESMPVLFNSFREKNIKITLNTGYSKEIQENIIRTLNMNEFIDGYISSEDVKYGRPYPYMIYNLMEKFEVESSQDVIKIGDTVNDMLEGRNARCLTIGVLSGADSREKLKKCHYILESVMDLSYEK